MCPYACGMSENTALEHIAFVRGKTSGRHGQGRSEHRGSTCPRRGHLHSTSCRPWAMGMDGPLGQHDRAAVGRRLITDVRKERKSVCRGPIVSLEQLSISRCKC